MELGGLFELDFFRTSVIVGRRLVDLALVSSCSSSIRLRTDSFSLVLEVGESLL